MAAGAGETPRITALRWASGVGGVRLPGAAMPDVWITTKTNLALLTTEGRGFSVSVTRQLISTTLSAYRRGS